MPEAELRTAQVTREFRDAVTIAGTGFDPVPANDAVSFNGAPWQAAQRQAYSQQEGEEHFNSYWMPAPAGIPRILSQAATRSGSPNPFMAASGSPVAAFNACA